MYAKQEATKEIVTALKKVIGKKYAVSIASLSKPPNAAMGDVAFGCFEFAKGEKRNPAEIATELAAKIQPGKWFSKAVAVGPYVNFTFADAVFGEKVLKDIKKMKATYGNGVIGKGKKVLIDYAQPNTHKEFHVGHLRNGLYGQSVIHVLGANGYETIAASYIGDAGAHIAKCLWALKKFHEGEKFSVEERAEKLGAIYTEASQYIEEHPEAKEEVAEVQRKIEAGEEPWASLWKETREWSLADFKRVFAELGIKPDVYYFESEVEEEGKGLVRKLLTDGIARKSEGAVIVDLEEEKLGVALVLKSDGSALYATKDIPLAWRKEEQFHPDRQIYIVDVRQSLYFQQLFAILRRMGFTKQLTHLSYDLVVLPDGAMSSRKGNIATYDDLKEKMVAAFVEETAKRHEDWSKKKVESTALALSLASIKFMMLRQDPQSILTFDMKEAMSFDGFTGPYLLYTVARMESLKAKTKIKPAIDAVKLTSPEEKSLIRALAQFPELVEKTASTYQISSILQWAFDTSKTFSEYYHNVHIVEEAEPQATAARLGLVEAVKTTLQRALALAGIETVKEM